MSGMLIMNTEQLECSICEGVFMMREKVIEDAGERYCVVCHKEMDEEQNN